MIRFLSALMALLISLITGNPFKSPITDYTEIERAEHTMNEYNSYIGNMANFPISFTYGAKEYCGFDGFSTVSRTTSATDCKETTETVLLHGDNKLQATVISAYYPEYNAYEWTVYFENISDENTAVISKINAADMYFAGSNPVLKGIYGDGDGWYEPYEKKIGLIKTEFNSDSGRSTDKYFPYFNLETDIGGVMLAVGWPGTWNASFSYDYEGNTHYEAEGTTGLRTYLKPGETIGTPLMAFLRYYERDEDKATNLWRSWYRDCNQPRETSAATEPIQPTTSIFMSADSPNPSSDGSVGFEYTSWKKTLDKVVSENLKFNYHWFDAGWYVDENNETIWDEWYRTGTLTLDKNKWPEDSFKQMTDACKAEGMNTLLWFEPERLGVQDFDAFCENFGYDKSWKIGNDISNLGNDECLDWTFNKIVAVLEETGANLYREDFNTTPADAWKTADKKEGINRKGITENKYIRGHLKLWEKIIDFCAATGRCTVIDSCASGGRRNDLQTMRLAVPFLRSDADRSTPEIRLSISTTLSKWLPYNGSTVLTGFSGDNTNEITYLARLSYLCHSTYCLPLTKDRNINFDLLRSTMEEREQTVKYYDKDFYVLTPWHSHLDASGWTAWMYFDAEKDEGVLQVFRQSQNDESEYTLCLKGVKDNLTYNLIDADSQNTYLNIKGSDLKNGIKITLPSSATAAVIYISK